MEKFIDLLPNPLLEDIVNNRCVPIIGAGFSANASMPKGLTMPLWKEVGKYYGKQLRHDFENPLDAISSYSHVYGRPKTIEHLRKILHIDNAKPGEVHKKFAYLQFDVIITTNFDLLLEKSFDAINRSYYPILEEEQLSINPVDPVIQNRITRIVKIHGDVNHPTRLVLTEDDYDVYLQNNPIMCTHIANLLVSRTPLFIGYSLDDPDFRTIWQIIGSRLGKLRRTAYTFGVNMSRMDVNRFERRGIKVIPLEGGLVS